MQSYSQVLWNLLGELMLDTEQNCIEFDSQVILKRERFLDYILFTVHYTKHYYTTFIVRTYDDFEYIIDYINLCLISP